MSTCPKCQRTDQQIKVGFNASGSQRFKCKICNRKYTPQPRSKGYPEAIRAQAVHRYMDGTSFRRIARDLKVHHQTIINWVNAHTTILPNALPLSQPIEQGELGTFGQRENTTFLPERVRRSKEVSRSSFWTFERIEKYAVILLLVFLSNGIFHKRIIDLPLTLFQVAAVGLALLTMWRYIPQMISTLIRDWPMVGVLFFALASVFWSLEPSISLRQVIWLYLTAVFGLYIGMRFSLTEQLWLVVGMVIVSLFTSLFVIVLFPQLGLESAEKHAGLWRGVFSQKNVFGTYLSLGALLVVTSGRRLGFWCWPLSLLLVTGVYKSGSATAIMSMFAILLVVPLLLFLLKLRHEFFTGIVLILIPFSAVIMTLIFMNYESIVGMFGRDPSLTGRTELWSAALTLIAQYPLTGLGFGAAFHDTSPIMQMITWRSAPFAHNQWIDIALDLGLVATAIFALGLCRTVLRAIAYGRQENTAPESMFPLVLLSFIIIVTLSTNSIISMADILWVMYVAVTYGLILRNAPPEMVPYRRTEAHNTA